MRKFMVMMLVFAMLFSTVAYGSPAQVSGNRASYMPPNEEAIAKLLVRQGVLDQNATEEEVYAAVKAYVSRKMTTRSTADYEKKEMFEELKDEADGRADLKNMIQNRKKGKNPAGHWDNRGKNWTVEEQEYTGEVTEIKLLVLLAEFDDDEYGEGPSHNEIEKPEAGNNSDFWVNDFSKEHYEQMLFTEGGYDAIDQNDNTLHLDSMTDYYMEQSNGSFKVDGDAYGWFRLPHSEAYYGDDSAAGTDDAEPGNPYDLVADLLDAAEQAGTVPFEDYDIEDIYDLDEDGDYYEPDGIIDHLVIVHAGVDQSGGGGIQGDDAIWAHSSSTMVYIPSDDPTVDYWDGNMLAYNYTIQGEDGTIGVFCHETAHDLGLPDEYDTIYSTSYGDNVGFYSLMSSGSWVGKPLGTKPTPISPWGRITLGQIWGGQWIQPTVVDSTKLRKGGKTYKLDQTTSWGKNNQVIKLDLPDKEVATVEAYAGDYSFYGGKDNELDNKLVTSLTLPESNDIQLSYKTWYEIEEGWDYGFVQVSTDEGENWTSLVSQLMTYEHNSQVSAAVYANLPGYTGSSDGWIGDSIDLSEYAGQDIQLSFRYMTDAAAAYDGFYVDDISVEADGEVIFSDGAENGEDNWTLGGWILSPGYEIKSHYYLLEWRSHNKLDESLKYCYNFPVSTESYVDYYSYEPGLLIWYRDTAYTDNWVGDHPGNGFLTVVDAHAKPLVVDGNVLRSRIQVHDAAFGTDRVSKKILTLYGKPVNIGGSKGVPVFDDSRAYWYEEAPYAGVKVPEYGIKVQVMSRSKDYSIGEIRIFK